MRMEHAGLGVGPRDDASTAEMSLERQIPQTAEGPVPRCCECPPAISRHFKELVEILSRKFTCLQSLDVSHGAGAEEA